MSEETSTPSGGGEAVSVVTVDAGTPAELTLNQAARVRGDFNEKRNKSAESAEPATAEKELSGEDNAPSVEEQAKGETQELDAEATPPLEIPRSWTKDQNDRWSKFDRETQEFLLDHEKKITSGVNRSLSEAAEKSKAAEAKLQEAEKARQLFEAKTQAEFKSGLDMQTILFPDIKTQEDVDKLVWSDPTRWAQWRAHQDSLQAQNFVLQEAKAREQQERQGKRAAYEAEQGKLLNELVPDMADPKKAAEKRERAVAMLTGDLGLKMETLQRWMQDDVGHEILSNAGIQKLIADCLTLQDIKTAKAVVAAKPLPPVLRPGASKPAGSAASEQVKTSVEKLNNSGKLNDAVAALVARRNAQRRPTV